MKKLLLIMIITIVVISCKKEEMTDIIPVEQNRNKLFPEKERGRKNRKPVFDEFGGLHFEMNSGVIQKCQCQTGIHLILKEREKA